MEFDMTAVFHYGKDSEKHIRRFQEKRLNYATRDLYSYSADKVEDEDSTFFNPRFSQIMSRKPIEEWIISVGRHEGFIPSNEWIETQELLAAIAEKYNRPHRRTNALLAGIIFCPICGKRLSVTSESNRWTHGKPRFKYTCPGVRKKECTFKAVDGVLLDEFVVAQLSNLSDENAVYYNAIFNEKRFGSEEL